MSSSVSYITIREQLDKSRAYDCNICPHSSPDLDLARAHYAVHVGGPELLTALKEVSDDALKDTPEMWERVDAAIAKYEPKG